MIQHIAYIGLGSNVGNLADNIETALTLLTAQPEMTSVSVSSLYATPPLGPSDQPAFLNGVARVETTLSATGLWAVLQQVEDRLGRVRDGHWTRRTMDLDLLLFDDAVIEQPGLSVPHRQMHLRSFVLKGLCELAPDLRHPRLGRTMRTLSARLNGGDYWIDPEVPQLVSIAGTIGVGKSTLARALAERLDATFITERYDENPYLADVYAGRDDLALDSELFFLSSSAAQLRRDRLFAGRRYVNDYVFEKAHIYASGWLGPADLERYERHFDSICEKVTRPVLAICLHDTIEHCLDRIRRRNRPYEQDIEPAFLEHLARGYEALYADYTVCPVMRLRPDECWESPQVDRIAEEVKAYIA